jgi:hypothetical protein
MVEKGRGILPVGGLTNAGGAPPANLFHPCLFVIR